MKNTILLTAALLLFSSSVFGQNKDTERLENAVEALRQLLINPDENALKKLTLKELSYGHSNGLVENQQEFVDFLLSGKSQFVNIKLEEQTVDLVDDVGLVRHVLLAQTNNEGTVGNIKLGVLMVWKKDRGQWKLLARQAVKLQ